MDTFSRFEQKSEAADRELGEENDRCCLHARGFNRLDLELIGHWTL